MLSNNEKAELLEAAKKEMPDMEFQIGTIVKRNDCVKEALIIKGQNGMTAPVFYIDDYADLTPSEMAKAAREMMEKFSINQDEIKETLLSPEFVMDNVRLQLLNTERNREFLKGKPYFKAGSDMSAVLYISIGENADAKAFLNDGIIEGMGLDVEALKKTALQNMWENVRIQSMSDTILGLMTGEDIIDTKAATDQALEELREGTMKDMIIITNAEKTDGAATVLCEEFKLACNQDLVLLPSSCHEMILLPYDQSTDLRELQKMVEEINRTAVQPSDFLSDNVYVFDNKSKEISMACDKYGLVPLCDDTMLQLGEHKVKGR